MSEILKELRDNDFSFKKKFGQNFITDTNLLRSIVSDAEVNEGDLVLEIGVGAGSLTSEISAKAEKVLAYEIDITLEEYLKEKFNGSNVNVIFNDFMKTTAEEVNAYFSNKRYKVVANLPYYITTPIIFKLIEENYNIESLTIMVQKEVAERVVSTDKSGDYGIISVLINAIADTKISRIVNRNMFTPAPNVDSAILNIKLKKDVDFDFSAFQKIVRKAFSMRRKTLNNNLKGLISAEDFENAGIESSRRAEDLSIDEFKKLASKKNKKGN